MKKTGLPVFFMPKSLYASLCLKRLLKNNGCLTWFALPMLAMILWHRYDMIQHQHLTDQHQGYLWTFVSNVSNRASSLCFCVRALWACMACVLFNSWMDVMPSIPVWCVLFACVACAGWHCLMCLRIDLCWWISVWIDASNHGWACLICCAIFNRT